MNRLVQAALRRAQRCAGQQTDGAGNLAGLVGKNVAEHVAGHHHVELAGAAYQLHGGIIHQHIGDGHIRIFRSDTVDGFAPEATCFQHVGLVD